VSPGTASVGVVPWGCTPSGYLTYTWQYPVGGLAITRATPTAFVLIPQPRRDRGTTHTQRVPTAGIYPLLAVGVPHHWKVLIDTAQITTVLELQDLLKFHKDNLMKDPNAHQYDLKRRIKVLESKPNQ